MQVALCVLKVMEDLYLKDKGVSSYILEYSPEQDPCIIPGTFCDSQKWRWM